MRRRASVPIARPTFPSESRSVMIPDPTTVATRSPVLSASEVIRSVRTTLGLDCGLASALLNENLPTQIQSRRRIYRLMPRTQVNIMFRAFSDPTRLRILHLLRDGEYCVGDLVTILRVPQPTASRHLAYLRRTGLVTTRKNGLWNFGELAAPRVKRNSLRRRNRRKKHVGEPLCQTNRGKMVRHHAICQPFLCDIWLF
jgi:DNA-binding transcriptional ArsR family regulator